MTQNWLRGRLLGTAAALIAATLAAGCGASDMDADGPVTLNVWLMKDSAPDALIKQIGDEFTKAHPKVTVKSQILDWDGRDAKWKTALASDNPPDVLEMGNTDMLAYSSSGALGDLSGAAFENKDTWLAGLKEAGTYNGKLYGVPYYGGDRIVIYRKDLWAKAGLTDKPKTLTALKAAGQKLMAGQPKDFSGLHFPGRYQYAALSFLYDTGGAIAKQDGDKWTGTLSSAESKAGLKNWQDFIKAVSTAPADADETNLPDTFGQGKTAMVIGPGWMVGSITAKYPDMKDKIDAFATPGTNGPMPVFLGGSNLVSAAGSKHPELAAEFIKLVAGTRYQTEFAKNGMLPNTTSLKDAVTGITAIQLEAATHSWFTPTHKKWSDVDNAKILMDMLQAIASGDKSIDAATKDADDKMNQILGS